MSTTTQKYEFVKIQGPLSVVPVSPDEVFRKPVLLYILMGPTGSGKSSFIETLSPDQNLDISKDTLESVTQAVNCYRVVNLRQKYIPATFVLMDTPGFLDTKLSESRITTLIMEKLDAYRRYAHPAVIAVFILYFQPITDIRISGSKRYGVKLLRAFADSFKASGITVMTSMWNQISTPKQIEDANVRFTSLKEEIYVESGSLTIHVKKFELSRASVLGLLDEMQHGWNLEKDTTKQVEVNNQYQSLIRENLLNRITNVLQQLEFLAEAKHSATTPGTEDLSLVEVVLRDEKAALAALQSFLDDLYQIDPASCSSPLPPLPTRVALKTRFRRFAVTGKRLFRKNK